MEKNGFIIIRNAIRFPNIKLKSLTKYPNNHSSTMWSLRFLVKKYFEKIWQDSDLVSCFGGNIVYNSNFSLPWHIDQNNSSTNNLNNHDFSCLQGVLALSYSDCTDFLCGSHKYFNSLSKRCCSNNPFEWEYYEIPKNDCIWNKGLSIYTPQLFPGDLLIFDSRTIHRVNKSHNRSVAYISMFPRKLIKNNILRLRYNAFKKAANTTHKCEKLIITGYDYDKNNQKVNNLV